MENRTSELLKLSINSITRKCKSLKLPAEGGKMDMIGRIIRKSSNEELKSLQNELKSKRNDMDKIANVLNGNVSQMVLNNLLTVYIKRSQDNNLSKQWLKTIEKFKQIYDNMRDLKNAKNSPLKETASCDINEETDDLIASFNNEELAEMKETLSGPNTNCAPITKLKQENEKYLNIIRTKDEIINNANDEIERLKKELSTIKEEDGKQEIVQMDAIKREKAKELLMKRVECEQANGLKIDEESDKKTISELLNQATQKDAMDVINSMGVLQFEYDKRLKKDVYTLNMTNNSTLRRLTNEQRKQFIFLLGHCLVNKENAAIAKIEKVKITNIGLGDKLFALFIDVLIENKQHFHTKEMWMESNKIGNVGMTKLAQFIALDSCLETVKLYNNKAVIGSKTINILLNAMEKNTNIVKFTFEWRLSHHRDRINKVLGANQERKRKEKWAKKIKK